MSWGGSLHSGFDLSSEIEHVAQCCACVYYEAGWYGVINPHPEICTHPKRKKWHNNRVTSQYYFYNKCKELIEKTMDKKITKETILNAVKDIKLYIKQNPRKYPEDLTIHKHNCEFNLGFAHGGCYCTEKRQTRLNQELDEIISAGK